MNYTFKRKIIYTLFTAPFAVLTFKAHNWQKRRKIEKINEIKIREERLAETPLKIDKDVLINDFEKEKVQYKPIELYGYFDYKNSILINKTKDSDPGFHVVTPFYCYKDNNYKYQALLVDRGWIPYDFILNNNEKQKFEKITGIIYKGDKTNKYSQVNDKKDTELNNELSQSTKKIFYMIPSEISNIIKLDNQDIASKFIIKQVDLRENSKQLYPRCLTKNDLMTWTITPEKHQDYANFWITATTLNIISNLIVWFFL